MGSSNTTDSNVMTVTSHSAMAVLTIKTTDSNGTNSKTIRVITPTIKPSIATLLLTAIPSRVSPPLTEISPSLMASTVTTDSNNTYSTYSNTIDSKTTDNKTTDSNTIDSKNH